MQHSLSLSPEELNSFARKNNEEADDYLARNIISRLNDEVKRVKNLKDNRPVERISVTTIGSEESKHAKLAVKKLKEEGYNVKYEYQEACDDGPNRSSPDYHRVVLLVG